MPESATTLLEQTLSRLHATDPKIHAYVHVDEEQARIVAERADASASKGPLHGLPFAVKEVIEVDGIPTAGGCPVLKNHVPAQDATVVHLLREAGAVLVGTQISHELTCGLDEPLTRNPWDTQCYPGGSSAGAGVSVAAGSASFTLGTDAAGSVRIPAAMTGTTGLKPTAGLVSKNGVLRQASAPSIDNVGIIARTVAEVREVLTVIAGPDPGDPNTLHQLIETNSDQKKYSRDLKGMKFAVLGEKTRAALDETWPMDEEIDRALASVCDQLIETGAGIVTIELPSLVTALPAIVTFFSTELAAAHRELVHKNSSNYHPEVLGMLKQAMDTPAAAVVDAVQARSRLCKEVLDTFNASGIEFLLTPTTPRVAMPLSTFDPTTELGSLIPYTCGFNLTGQPALSIPCGFTSSGLPIGLQIVGLPCKDLDVLRLAEFYQQRSSWHKQTPSIS